MEKFIRFILIAILTTIVASCDDINFATPEYESTFQVIGSINNGSRTTYEESEGVVRVGWAEGDLIGLIIEGIETHYCYRAITEGASVRFEPIGEPIPVSEGQKVTAYYPYNSQNQTSSSFQLPYFYGSSSWIKMSDLDAMVSHGVIANNSLHLDFNHIFSFIEVKIKRDLIKDLNPQKNVQFSISSQFAPLTCYKLRVEGDSRYAEVTDFDIVTDTIVYDEKAKFQNYSLDLNSLTNDDEIRFYAPILPSDTSDNLIVSYSQYPNPEVNLLWRKTPTSGCRAGHIYQFSIDRNEIEEEILREKEILMEFYYATNGDEWKHNDNWGSDEPFHKWYGISSYRNRIDYIGLPNNNLSGNIPKSLSELPFLTSLDLENNNLTGSIPSEIYLKPELSYLKLCGNKLSGILPDLSYTEDLTTQMYKLNNIVYQQEGYTIEFPKYESKNYGDYKNLRTLQKHTKGSGLKIVIMGEMYTDRDIENGLFSSHVDDAYEALFSREPYTSLREYFDVYSIETVSKTNFMGYGTYFNTGYEFDRMTFITNSERIANIIKSLPETNYQTSNVTTVIMMNTTAPFRSNCHMWTDGFAAGFCVFGHNKNGRSNLILHEVCGHGFGKLSDEYDEFEGSYPIESQRWLDEDHAKNWAMNVDYHSNPKQVIWSYFLSDPRYKSEKLGMFEGADYYPKGIFRATENSLMRYSSGEFNAPSRQSIYRRIMELSGEEYSLEKFLEYDEINRQRYNNGTVNYSRSENSEIKDMSNLTAPPVIHRYPASR